MKDSFVNKPLGSLTAAGEFETCLEWPFTASGLRMIWSGTLTNVGELCNCGPGRGPINEEPNEPRV